MPELPCNKEAEMALLGAAIGNPAIVNKLSISPDDFYTPLHADIYRAILKLHREKKTIDILSISEIFYASGKDLPPGYLMDIDSNTPSYLHAESYQDIVKEDARRRGVVQVISSLNTAAFDKKSDLDAAISAAISGLANKANIKNGAVHISEFMSKLYDVVSEKHDNPVKPGEVSGISSGFQDFDNITDGFHPGEETILTAEPGLGKSLLAFQMACNMARQHPGVVYELEMSGLAVAKRQVANMANIATRDMDRGTMENWTDFVKTIEDVSGLKLHISDDTRLTTTTLRADLARLREEYGIRWFVLDYLALLKDSKGKDDIERTAWLSSEVHGICKDLRLAGLVIHSMNKQGVRENNGSQADLSGSVRVIYDADQIIMMQRDKQFENQVNLNWSKFREGELPKGGMSLIKRPGLPAFVSKARI